MALWLVDESFRWTLEVAVRPDLEAPLRAQIARLHGGGGEAFALRLAPKLAISIEAALDDDLRPPSTHQIAFAKAISKALCVPLPTEVMTSRRAIGAFLDEHGEVFKARARISPKS